MEELPLIRTISHTMRVPDRAATKPHVDLAQTGEVVDTPACFPRKPRRPSVVHCYLLMIVTAVD